MKNIADNHDREVRQVPPTGRVTVEPGSHREGVEQCLRRVLVCAVTGVDDVRVDPSAVDDGFAHSRVGVAKHDELSSHGLQSLQSVLEALPLRHA